MDPPRVSRRALLGGAAGLALGSLGACRGSREAPAILEPPAPRDLAAELVEHGRTVPILDAHEHLETEPDRVSRQVDALTLLSTYVHNDLRSAGADFGDLPGQDFLLDTNIPLHERWRVVWPFLKDVRHTSFYRPTRIALRDLYGIDDLDDTNYVEVTRRMQEANTPGVYARVLRGRCNIAAALVQNMREADQVPADLLIPVITLARFYIGVHLPTIEVLGERYGVEVRDLDGYLEVLGRHVDAMVQRGAVALKIHPVPCATIDRDDARKRFLGGLRGVPVDDNYRAAVMEHLVWKAREHDLPVAVHTGVWQDYRRLDPKLVIDLLERHPDIRFDIYHLGMPYVLDTVFLAKNYPNAYLNLCWAYQVSEEVTRRAIGDVLDLVPINKVFAFGGDARFDVENVYGNLEIARETLAGVLAERVTRGRLDLAEAQRIQELWLRDNPIAFYRLGERLARGAAPAGKGADEA